MKNKITITVAACLLTGCAYLRSTTLTETDPKTGVMTQKTVVRAYTLFDASANLTKFRNSNGATNTNGWPAGTTVGTVNEQSSLSNAVLLLQSAAAIAAKMP